MTSQIQPSARPESATTPAEPTSDIPELTTYLATTSDDKIAALRLIADSVAQQRQQASRAIIFHPLVLGAFGVILAGLIGWSSHGESSPHSLLQLLSSPPAIIRSVATSDLPFILTTFSGILMTVLIAIRWACSGYIYRAEEIGKGSLLRFNPEDASETSEDDQNDDTIFVTRFGDRVIGAIALRPEHKPALSPPSSAKSKSKSKSEQQTKTAQILAWTVLLRYRRNGVGTNLLDQAVQHVRDSYGLQALRDLQFAENHANSLHILPRLFNAPFERNEKWAREKLVRAIASSS